MTRINCIPPSELTDKHLQAEYRELPRVFGYVRLAIEKGEKPDNPRFPSSYTLGQGHVLFFYPRLGYLLQRQEELIEELLERGFKLSDKYLEPRNLARGIPEEWFEDWCPPQDAINLNRKRIADRLEGKT